MFTIAFSLENFYNNSIGFLIPVILIFAILSFFSFCRGGRAPPLSGARGGRVPGRPPP